MARKRKDKKHKITMSGQLVRIIAVILLLVMIAIITVTYRGLDVIYLAYSAVKSSYAAREIEDITSHGITDFQSNMDAVERSYELNVELYDKDGRFVYASAYKGEMSDPPYDADTIVIGDDAKKDYELVLDLGSTSNNSFNLSRDTSDDKNSEYLVLTWKMDSGITMKLFKLKSVVDTNAKIAMTFISIITVSVVFIAMLLIMIFVRKTTKPLENMSKVTNNMAKLDFSKKCDSSNIQEISVLADSINDMSDSLENSLVDLQKRNKKLQEDIEQEKTIEQLREVFISGVSHELKTPIAIIQGYAEGLKMFLESGDTETADKYSDTIISETERMNQLVMKLLEIIKYESGDYKPYYETFIMKDIIDEWFSRNSEILKDKGITAVDEIDKSVIAFGDSFILSTVVNNYMSNAVSHVGGDMIIKAYATELPGNIYRISIFNTGTPIASKDIDKIWDSFYRADKSLSRSQGRFGLGLAIVAAIQKLHKQEYGVVNHEDGVEFWFNVGKSDEVPEELKDSNETE